MAQATRLLAMPYETIGSADVATICAEDIEMPDLMKKPETKRIGFCA